MRVDEFDYPLPPDRIAQRPASPRDASRLLVIDRAPGSPFEHRHFRDLPELLAPNDLLVANDSRVLPARLHARKDTGGGVELLLLRSRGSLEWEALIRGRVRAGTRLEFALPGGEPLMAAVIQTLTGGVRVVRFDRPPAEAIELIGELPLPPYITTPPESPDHYQTVYARITGSVAAPTAGLHFTQQLIDRLAQCGVRFAFVTLHVGLDTFRPMRSERIEDHAIHTEWCTVPAETVDAIRATRNAGGRIIAVGTTTVRALETAALAAVDEPIAPFCGWTSLYIRPGHVFRAVDGLITNFHLPRSSLLVLVAAFTGKDRMLAAYHTALSSGYRFLSFGDAMLIR